MTWMDGRNGRITSKHSDSDSTVKILYTYNVTLYQSSSIEHCLADVSHPYLFGIQAPTLSCSDHPLLHA